MRPRYHDTAMRGFERMLAPWRWHMLSGTVVSGLEGARAATGLAAVAAGAAAAGAATSPAHRPLLLVANHTSWWDGFLLRDLHRALRPDAPLFTVMTRRELDRHPYFRLMGAVPLDVGTATGARRLVRQLRDAVDRQPDATITYFPQGRIWPAWRRPLGFHRGIELLTRALKPCTVLPVGIHIEPLNRGAPTAFLHCGRPLHVGADNEADNASATLLERHVVECLDTLQQQLAQHGEAAPERMGSKA